MTSNERIKVGEFVSIYRRGKKNIYTAEFWRHGQHRRRSLKTTRLREARKRAIELDREIADGSYTSVFKSRKETKEMKLSKSCENFISFLETEGRRRKTLVVYLNSTFG